jgi:hypothetical protein
MRILSFFFFAPFPGYFAYTVTFNKLEISIKYLCFLIPKYIFLFHKIIVRLVL